MPAITRVGDLSTGHDDCSAVPAVTGASNVLVNGQPVVCVGDSYASHGCIHHPSHAGQLIEGAPSFFINGKAVGRVGDAISCGQKVAEGASFCIVGNGNEQKLNKAIAERNEKVTKYIRSREDDIFYCLPRIAEAMAEKESNEDDKKGWLYLRDMFYKWLAGNANADPMKNPDPFWVDIDWVLRYFGEDFIRFVLARKAIKYKATKWLGDILLREGYLTKENREFDFINSPWQMWQPYYYQGHSIKYDELFFSIGLLAALGSFVFRYLAKGRIEYKGNNEYIIHIDEVAIFVYDSFNFVVGDNDYGLGYWSCEEKDMDYTYVVFSDTYYEMNNEKFNEFRERTGFGNDFLVLSKPKLIDNFNPYSYTYTIK